MQGIGTAGMGGMHSFDGDWQKLYRSLKGAGKIVEADRRSDVQCCKKDGYVGIEFDLGDGAQDDVRLAPCSRRFVPANGMEGTRIGGTGDEGGKKVYFFKVDAAYIPDGAEADLRFEVVKNGEKMDDRELKVTVREHLD